MKIKIINHSLSELSLVASVNCDGLTFVVKVLDIPTAPKYRLSDGLTLISTLNWLT